MKQYTKTEIKKLNSYQVSGVPNTNLCRMTLYNYSNEEPVETDAVFIELTQNNIRYMIKSLEAFLKPEEEA